MSNAIILPTQYHICRQIEQCLRGSVFGLISAWSSVIKVKRRPKSLIKSKLLLLMGPSLMHKQMERKEPWVQIPGGYRGYRPSKNLSQAAKYCISPQNILI